MGKIVAIFGSNGTGKTTFAAALANMITKKSKEFVLLVNDDNRSPISDVWLHSSSDMNLESAGNILNNPDIDRGYLLSQSCDEPYRLIPLPSNKNIALVGYLTEDNIEKYDPITEEAAYEFFNVVKSEIPEIGTTIVDASEPVEHNLSRVAIEIADIVIGIIEPNPKGVAFTKAMATYFDRIVKSGRQYHLIFAPVYDSTALQSIRNLFGISYYDAIEYCTEAKEKFDSCDLFSDYRDKKYNSVVTKVAEEILQGKADTASD